MRVDKDDRYVSEQPKKTSAPSFQLPSFLEGFSKTKLIILALAMVIILLLLILIIFRSSHKSEPELLTPPTVGNASAIDDPNGIGGESNLQNTPEPQTIAPAPISGTPTESTQNRNSSMQERVEIPGDVTDELNSVNLKPKAVTPTTQPKTNTTNSAVHSNATEPAKIKPQTKTPVKVTPAHTVNNTNSSTPTKIANDRFVIQLNASSSSESLKSFAKQNQLTNYQIYETKRNSKPWFVLIKGNYASSNEAKEAIKSLPTALQKSSPWIKSGATINKEKAEK